MPKDKFPHSPKMSVYQQRTQTLEVELNTIIDLESDETRGEYYHALIDAVLTENEHETHEEYLQRLYIAQTRAVIREIQTRAKETLEREYSTWINSDALKFETIPHSRSACVIRMTARITIHDSGGKAYTMPEPDRLKESRA